MFFESLGIGKITKNGFLLTNMERFYSFFGQDSMIRIPTNFKGKYELQNGEFNFKIYYSGHLYHFIYGSFFDENGISKRNLYICVDNDNYNNSSFFASLKYSEEYKYFFFNIIRQQNIFKSEPQSLLKRTIEDPILPPSSKKIMVDIPIFLTSVSDNGQLVEKQIFTVPGLQTVDEQVVQAVDTQVQKVVEPVIEGIEYQEQQIVEPVIQTVESQGHYVVEYNVRMAGSQDGEEYRMNLIQNLNVSPEMKMLLMDSSIDNKIFIRAIRFFGEKSMENYFQKMI